MSSLQQLEQLVGEFIEYWGFKRLHGRIWTHLFLSEKPLDTKELMERLKVSKGMMSIMLRELLEYDVILIAGEADHGTFLYTANPDLASVICGVLKKRELTMLRRVHETCMELKAQNGREPESMYAHIEKSQLRKLEEAAVTAERLLKNFLLLADVKRSLEFTSLLKAVRIKSI